MACHGFCDSSLWFEAANFGAIFQHFRVQLTRHRSKLVKMGVS
jgi:hypothetical protein